MVEGAGQDRHSALRKSAASQAQVLTFAKDNFHTLTLTVPAGGETSIEAKMKSPYPLKNIFKLFLDPIIPDRGPDESKTTPDCGGNTEPSQNLIAFPSERGCRRGRQAV